MNAFKMTCRIPDCPNPVENPDTGLCATHGHELRKAARMPEKKPKTPIRKRSVKREGEERAYNKEAKEWLKGRKCEFPGCNVQAQSVHHKKGRENELLFVKEYWAGLCLKHHIWVTEHSKEAIEMGLSLPRNS